VDFRRDSFEKWQIQPTTTVPVMKGWNEQRYVKLPAVGNSTVADAPGWMVPASNAPVDDVAVCCCPSLFVQATDPPTGTCTSAGPNLKSAIPTAPASAAADPATVVSTVGVAVVIEVATGAVVALLELSLEQAPMMGSARARRANRYLIALRSERPPEWIGVTFEVPVAAPDAGHVG
jgi:hypothetical protein